MLLSNERVLIDIPACVVEGKYPRTVQSVLCWFIESVHEYAEKNLAKGDQWDVNLHRRYNTLLNILIRLYNHCTNGRHNELYAGVCLCYEAYKLSHYDEPDLYKVCGALSSMLYTIE